ncbi:MAG TPA: hypothetical protein VFZ32_21575 [Micromonosporaceae bacterium]
MDAFWPLLGAFVAVGGALASLPWLASRARRRGIAGTFLNVADEIFHPSGQQSRIVIEVQSERKVPTPSPGDPPA